MGGVTYEEARAVAEMNQNNPGVRIVLGGTTVRSRRDRAGIARPCRPRADDARSAAQVHNSASFLAELTRIGPSPAIPPPPSSSPALGATGVAGGKSFDRGQIAALTQSSLRSACSSVQAGMTQAMQAASKYN